MDVPIPFGTRVQKINSKPEDHHRDGATARVLNAIGPAEESSGAGGTYGYIIEFDDAPGSRYFIAGTRIARIATAASAAA